MDKIFEFPDLVVNIINTRDATIAHISFVLEGREYSWSGTSKRNPEDKYVPGIGRNLALGRALEKAGKSLQRQANGVVKCMDDNRERTHKPMPTRLRPTRRRQTVANS